MKRIQALEARPDNRLSLVWDDGSRGLVDFSRDIARGGVFAPLADERVFRQVRLGPRQRTIEWPVDAGAEQVLDIDADALYERAVLNHELMPV